MVEEIKALRASDGTIFSQEQEFDAIRYEARLKLEQTLGKTVTNEVMASLTTVVEVFQALAPLASAIMARREQPQIVGEEVTPAEHYSGQAVQTRECRDDA